MQSFTITGQTGNSEIILGTSMDSINKYYKGKKLLIITDKVVNSLYGKVFPEGKVIEIGSGERIKTIDTAEYIYEKFLEFEADRKTFVIGIGGGIVCDITGFVASTYMRGLPFGFIPTTLLAQVDASIGGKNGVNFKGYKNIIGTFNQPSFVLCNADFLKTLPEKELLCGFAEVIKHAAIKEPFYFEYLEEHADEILSLFDSAIEEIVSKSISIKTQVVNSDEKESSERKKLNFGHTLGHAIEKATSLPHGESVSIGMIFANDLSVSRGILNKKDSDRFKKLLEKFSLPSKIRVDKKMILDAIKKDKKRDSLVIDFIILEKIGLSRISPIRIEELEEIILRYL